MDHSYQNQVIHARARQGDLAKSAEVARLMNVAHEAVEENRNGTLAAQTTTQNRETLGALTSEKILRPVMSRIGNAMVGIGSQLQERYGDIPTKPAIS